VIERHEVTMDMTHDPLRRDRARRSAPTTSARAGNAAYFKGQPVDVPRNYRQAMKSPHADEWRQSTRDHLQMHRDQGSWVETIVPCAQRAIPMQWVFQPKTDGNDEVTKWKARAVALGNLQRPGLDFDQTFAPTIRGEQVRLLVAIGAALKGAKLRDHPTGPIAIISTGDVSDAYLSSDLIDDNVYISLPEGYVPALTTSPGFKVVGKVKRGLPGLRQSGRYWHIEQEKRLLERGFKPCTAASCIYVKEISPTEYLVIGVFVDDWLVLNLTSDPNAVTDLIASLSGHFVVKMAAVFERFLGAQFESRPDGIYMHLTQYVRGLLERFGMSDSRPAATPEAGKDESSEALDETLLNRADTQLYQQITGALLFASTTVRLDLAHAVNMLARRMSVPRVCDMKAARRVLRYLRGTIALGLLFRYAPDPLRPNLSAFADADWAGDEVGRRSTSGYVVLYNGAPIAWHSGLQSIVALSTCESEYIALAECAREISYLRTVLAFLRREESNPTTIFEDNQGTIHLVENPVHHKRSKHIEVRFHYIRLAQQTGIVKVTKVHTDDNRADIFTKSTPAMVFRRHVSALMFLP